MVVNNYSDDAEAGAVEGTLRVKQKVGGEETLLLEESITLNKELKKDKVKELSGDEVETWIGKAKRFTDRMEKLAEKIERMKLESPMQEDVGLGEGE